MTDKSAMERMWGCLEARRIKYGEPVYGADDFNSGVAHAFKWAEAKARRLLAEEQAQKPTAPAGLVEELNYEITRDYGVQPDDDACEVDQFWVNKIKEILSSYTPRPRQCGVGGS